MVSGFKPLYWHSPKTYLDASHITLSISSCLAPKPNTFKMQKLMVCIVNP